MKKADLIYNVLLVPLDFIMLLLAGWYAYALRYTGFFVTFRPVVFELPFSVYFQIVMVMAIVWIGIFALFGLYHMKRSSKLLGDLIKIVGACTTGLAVVTFAIFFGRELFSSRFIVLAAWLFAIIFVSLGRAIAHRVRIWSWRKNIGVKRIMLIGNDKMCGQFRQAVEQGAIVGYAVVAQFRKLDDSNYKQVIDLVQSHQVDVMVQVEAVLDKKITRQLLDISYEYHVPFMYAADLFDMQSYNVEVTTVGGVPFVEFKKTPLEGWGQVYKRIIDVLGSTVGIILFTPVMGVIAIAIKYDSKGPIFYKSERVSKDKKFHIYKFRSMNIEYCTGENYDADGKALEVEAQLIAEKNTRQGPVYKVGNDPRRTRVGRFLEKTSLDELPQFFNVFKGDLSLVGPRPHQEREVLQYTKHHKKVLAIKPGLTGMAQVSGRSDLDFDTEVKLDSFYIENWNIWLDFAIIAKTPFVILFKRHK